MRDDLMLARTWGTRWGWAIFKRRYHPGKYSIAHTRFIGECSADTLPGAWACAIGVAGWMALDQAEERDE